MAVENQSTNISAPPRVYFYNLHVEKRYLVIKNLNPEVFFEGSKYQPKPYFTFLDHNMVEVKSMSYIYVTTIS